MGKPRSRGKSNRIQKTESLAVTLGQVRAFWAKRQGLEQSIQGDVAEILRKTGWIYSPGSTSPYLAIKARTPRFSRPDVDRAVFDDGSVAEVPTMRAGMLVPAKDRPLALDSARRFYESYFEGVREACSLRERELLDIASAITTILKAGPLGADTIRELLPAPMVRPLRPVGKKFQDTSTVSLVLRQLWVEGRVARFATDRSLDGNRYSYRLAEGEPAEQYSQQDSLRELARRFFAWAAPATVKEFAWWAGTSQGEARSVLEFLKLRQVAVTDWADEAWIHEEDLDALERPRSSFDGGVFVFLPFRDNYLYFRRGLAPFLAPAAQKRPALDWRNKPVPLGELESLHHNAIVWEGRLVGMWEYDPEEERVVWTVLEETNRKSLLAGIEDLEQLIRKELGDVRFYAVDTGPKRRDRIKALTTDRA